MQILPTSSKTRPAVYVWCYRFFSNLQRLWKHPQRHALPYFASVSCQHFLPCIHSHFTTIPSSLSHNGQTYHTQTYHTLLAMCQHILQHSASHVVFQCQHNTQIITLHFSLELLRMNHSQSSLALKPNTLVKYDEHQTSENRHIHLSTLFIHQFPEQSRFIVCSTDPASDTMDSDCCRCCDGCQARTHYPN